MKFITHYKFLPEARNEAIRRFKETGGAAPEGVNMHGRWHATSGNEGWILSETDDAKAQMEWIMRWSDLLSFEITPVGDDAEFTEVLNRIS
jgi:hypothetical protein